MSKRDRLQLRSRLCVICQDHRGNKYNPVRVHSKFTGVKSYFASRRDPGNAVFIGCDCAGSQAGCAPGLMPEAAVADAAGGAGDGDDEDEIGGLRKKPHFCCRGQPS